MSPAADAREPIITISSGVPYVTWRETTGGVFQTFVKHLNGATWVQNGASLNTSVTVNAFAPTLSFDGATPYAAWAEAAGSLYALRIKRLE